VAFLNDDAIAEPGWLRGLFAALDAGREGTVCAASHIRSKDGSEIEFSGASANLFGVGRPQPVWGWPDSPELPQEGSAILFASGGAMLIDRQTFLDVGGFDPDFFAYFEDVDLGWRLWVLGYRVVYAPNSVVRHIGGATGTKFGAHKRYTLWECNSLAVIAKNYESGNMEKILSAALLLLYKRALLSAGDAFRKDEYRLTAGRDTNEANVERLPKVSVAHLAAIDRFNRLLPHFMEERRTIQANRVRSDAEILPLLGRAYEPQFAGSEYAEVARRLTASLDLYGLTEGAAPNRVLILAGPGEIEDARRAARRIQHAALVAVAAIGADNAGEDGITLHSVSENDPTMLSLVEQADAMVVFPGAVRMGAVARSDKPKLEIHSPEDSRLVEFARRPGAIQTAQAVQ
jgi:GT2 family glycosyltransferase